MIKPAAHFCKQIVKKVHVSTSLGCKTPGHVHHEYNVAAMQQKRMLKRFNMHYNAKLRVVGSGALGTPAFVYLITDHSNYLFNCGEGTQRLSQEHHCKLSRLDNIFITNPSWKNVGGLPGLLLTGQDNGLTTTNIHSPEGLDNFMDTVQTFTYYPNLKISYPDVNEHTVYKDNIMQVTYVPITKSLDKIEKCSTGSVNATQYHSNLNGKRPIDVKTEANETNVQKKIKSIPRVLCYICEVHPRHGKLLIDKCIEFGIPPGPLCNKLKQGLDITKDDGTVVSSKDVCLPDSPKTTFLVVECPTEEYLDSFINHPAFSKYQRTTLEAQNEEVFCVFHFTPEGVFTNQQYQDWIKRFSSTTEHVILNDANTCMGSEAVHKNQYLLNMLHPEIFPILNKTDTTQNEQTESNSIHRARALQTLIIRPVPKPLTTQKIHKTPQMYINEVSKIPNFLDTLKELKANIDKKSAELDLGNVSEFPRVLMLGTGCSVPNKVRNTSGILLRVDQDNSILLDCGEGTLGQIIRFYGVSEADKILRSIKAIYISHIHADHHLGLIGLLLRRKKLTNDQLYLLTPRCITAWLNFYNDRFESISPQYILVNNGDLYRNRHKLSAICESTLYSSLNIKEINTIYVAHCKQSFGVAITLKDNKKIVYSGDTMFSQNLIELGKDCDLLIHEATMENGLETLAKRKLHSTTSEAINAGKFMQAKFTLLTHFSQRYSKIPALPEEEKCVGLAYDNMEIKLSHLPLLPLFYPCIKVMFNSYNKVMKD